MRVTRVFMIITDMWGCHWRSGVSIMELKDEKELVILVYSLFWTILMKVYIRRLMPTTCIFVIITDILVCHKCNEYHWSIYEGDEGEKQLVIPCFVIVTSSLTVKWWDNNLQTTLIEHVMEGLQSQTAVNDIIISWILYTLDSVSPAYNDMKMIYDDIWW